NQRQGHSALALILPFVEQDNIVRISRQDLSVIDPINWPPSYATPLGAAPGSVAGPTKISVFQCPSTPEVTIDYQPYFTKQGVPNFGPFPLGRTDYAPVRGLHSNFTTACAPASPPDPSGDEGVGALGNRGQRTEQGLKGQLRLTAMKDGTSNTIVIAEDAGR